jgi:NhaP-type Na+/H+ or K+/H+ antiporter
LYAAAKLLLLLLLAAALRLASLSVPHMSSSFVGLIPKLLLLLLLVMLLRRLAVLLLQEAPTLCWSAACRAHTRQQQDAETAGGKMVSQHALRKFNAHSGPE